MARLKNMSLKTKLITTMAMMLILLSGALMVKATHNTTKALHGAVDSENVIGINTLAYTLAEVHPELTRVTGENPEDFTITWPSMPSTIAFDEVDSTQTITGLDPTVFKFDEGTQAFTRIGTTLRAPDGNRAVMTELAPGPAYDALVNGEIFTGHTNIQGAVYEALYVPVFDADGSITGAFAVVRPLASVHAMIEQATVEAIAIAIGILLVALLIAFFTIRKMLAPITHMTASIEDLSNGSLDSEIGYQNRSDEIGKISNSLVLLQRSMQQAEELKLADVERSAVTDAKKREQDIVVEALSEGLSRLGNLDLSKQIENSRENPFPSDYEALRTSFNMLVDNLSESLEAIRDVATEVNNDAKEMADASGDLSSRTESQAATLEESAAALEEMSASVQSTAANASEAEATTQENRTNAKRTGEIVGTAIDAMASIEESSQKITQIISVIDDIAFQTNLLALNAGVEAARAGEAGRGFAVVASEVRALAQHSSSSAQEIKTLIASSSGHVENGSKLVRKAGESIGDIIERVDRVSGLVSDIAVSAKEQSIGVTEITAAVRDLDAATQGNAAMAEETSAASEGLTGASDRLTNHLARFKLAGAPSSNWAETAASASIETHADDLDDAAAFASIPPKRTASQSAPSPQVNAFQDF